MLCVIRAAMTEKTSSHKYLLRIGGIVAYWSVTEFMCDQALALLLQVDVDVSRAVTVPGMDFDRRLDVLRSVSRRAVKDGQTLEEFHAILDQVASASRERRNVVHSVWFNLGYQDLTDTAYSFKRGEVPISESAKYTPEKLEQTLRRIKDATEALTSFLLEHFGMSNSMPHIQIEGPGDSEGR